MDNIETFCPYCDESVTAPIVMEEESVNVRGENVTYLARIARCPQCGEAIGDSRVEEGNLERAYDAYRVRFAIPSPADIKELRNAYGLSLREFSRFLGFGEQTVARYERGALPDDVHVNTIVQAQSAPGAQMLLDANRERISPTSIAKVENFIQERQGAQVDYSVMTLPLYSFVDSAPERPCSDNGFRVLDLQRLQALANRLARMCSNLYKTKFQKAMFLCDSLAYERFARSLTGLSYAHADFGPVIDGKEEVMHYLASQGSVRYDEQGWGEVVSPAGPSSDGIFSDEEIALIDEVAAFVDSFTTAKSISDFSHQLEAWKQTPSGKRIAYGINTGEVGRAIETR